MVQDRAKTVLELRDQLAFVLAERPLVLEAKIRTLLEDEANRSRLHRLAARLSEQDAFTPEALDLVLKSFAESEGVGLGKIGPVLRGALAGANPAPDLSKTLAALGQAESLARLDDVLSSLA